MDCPSATQRASTQDGSERTEHCEDSGGVPHGPWRALRKDGTPRLVGQFARGQRAGDWQELDEDGGVTTRYHYERGALTNTVDYLTNGRPLLSRLTVFRADGSPEYEKYHLDGVPDGEATYWDANGEVTRVETYREGRLAQSHTRPTVRAIEAVFGRLVAALNGRGRASLYVDDETLGRYAQLQHAALAAVATEVRARPLIEQMLILRFRLELSEAQLAAATPESLIDLGLIPPLLAPLPTDRISDVQRSDEGRATAALVRAGRQTSERVSFVRIDSRWRVDLFSVFGDADEGYRQLAKQHGVTENEIVRRLVQVATGRTVPGTIWDPPAPTPSHD